MKPLSELLTDLATRVKQVEDSITDARDKGRAALQQRRQELEADLDRKKGELDALVTELQDAPRSWWADTKGSIEDQITTMRTDFQQWQSDVREKGAKRAADYAEENANAAMKLAEYFLNTAEWAAVQARLARAEADELVEES